MVTMRPFDETDADYRAVVDIFNAIWPEYPMSVSQLKHWDTCRNPKYKYTRILGELDGRAVASCVFGESQWTHVPGKYFVGVNVHPDFQRRGIGTQLYDHIVSVIAGYEPKPEALTSDTREDKPAYVRFLTKRGFVQKMREQSSRLDLQAFDPERFREVVERVEAMGVEIVTAAELEKRDPDWWREHYELDWIVGQDIPTMDPIVKRDFEVFRKAYDGPGFVPEMYLIALLDGRQIGTASLWELPASPDRLYTELTGVVPEHRRKGIATALKVRSLELGKKTGAAWVDTDNNDQNPMYLLNVRLGFKPMPGWLVFRKELEPGELERPRAAAE